ncbi:CD9 antigen-like [Neocloeon triangulifer]|uniref:CD9 antigen-like n=1 Tax=Neocloeon triangulifer TaxID=2078957 RepID=UPI00286F9A47|nr:CD9 antigen-like [Neocloeon triangulifer]
MALRGCCGLLKYIVVIVNLVFWLAGLAILGLATWLIVDPRMYTSLLDEEQNYFISLYILLIVGALMFIIGFLGCTGAFRESQCMLVLFFCFLLIILVAEIAAGAWAYTHQDRLDALIEDSVMTTVKRDYTDGPSRARTFDTVQQRLECCGAKGPSDWALSTFNQKNPSSGFEIMISSAIESYKVPTSCCSGDPESEECQAATEIKGPLTGAILKQVSIFSEGCTAKILQWKVDNTPTFVLIFVGIIALELFGLLFSIVLCCAIRSMDRYKA